MITAAIERPKFCLKQWVSFVGGEGIVQNYIPDVGTWTYLIEMTLGPEPDCGRVGAETMVLLNEADLRAMIDEVELCAA